VLCDLPRIRPRDIADEFTEQLVEETNDLSIGKPENRETVVSPLIDDSAIERYDDICETAAADGTVLTGGSRIDRKPPDRPVRPSRPWSRTFRTITRSRRTSTSSRSLLSPRLEPRGRDYEGQRQRLRTLCWPLLRGRGRIDTWFDRIESGMCYVNREQSATTGALVEAQPFGGWKYSGTTGKFAGGPWYLQQFMRQQSRTVVGDVGQPWIATATAGPISAPP